jgi:hypothetical protein
METVLNIGSSRQSNYRDRVTASDADRLRFSSRATARRDSTGRYLEPSNMHDVVSNIQATAHNCMSPTVVDCFASTVPNI